MIRNTSLVHHDFGDDLERELTQLRSALADEYDIPWAPYDEASALASR